MARQGVSMADGAILVVDVNEGLKGQARFVAEAIQSRLSIILLLNKVDRFEASALEERCAEIVTQVGDVLIDNDATDGWALLDLAHDVKDMSQLLEEIIKCVPAPATTRLQEPFQMLVSMISKDDKCGRFMIGRIAAGVISQNDKVKAFRESNTGVVVEEGRVLKIMKRAGLDGVIVEKAYVGDIVSLGGLKSVQVGDTLAHMEVMTCVPPLVFDKPKICMVFGVNDSPVAGQDGKKVSIRQLYDRLVAISNRNPAFKVYREGASVAVRGQGVRQMGILLQMVRREGFELLVSRQQLTDGKDEAAVPTLRKGVMVSNASGRVSEAALMRLQHLGTAISALHIYDFFWVCSMDDMDLFHGQTICSRVSEVNYSMVTSMSWKDHIINIADTPGHEDFIGEVQQGVSMADGAIFVVDVNERLNGQARFVVEAIRSKLSIILLLNKVDRFEERRAKIETQVCDVLIDYDATSNVFMEV